MKNFVVLGASAVGAAGASIALFGTGIASADSYAGQSYADASSAASDAGQSVTIASRTGSLPDDECTVTRSQTAPFLESDFVTHTSGSVQFYLNCTAAYATAAQSGASIASPEGRAAKSAARHGRLQGRCVRPTALSCLCGRNSPTAACRSAPASPERLRIAAYPCGRANRLHRARTSARCRRSVWGSFAYPQALPPQRD